MTPLCLIIPQRMGPIKLCLRNRIVQFLLYNIAFIFAFDQQTLIEEWKMYVNEDHGEKRYLRLCCLFLLVSKTILLEE
jgi:hypothetical protein